MKLTRQSSGNYEVVINNELIEIWKSEDKLWFVSNEPDAYFETLKGVRDYLETLIKEEE